MKRILVASTCWAFLITTLFTIRNSFALAPFRSWGISAKLGKSPTTLATHYEDFQLLLRGGSDEEDEESSDESESEDEEEDEEEEESEEEEEEEEGEYEEEEEEEEEANDSKGRIGGKSKEATKYDEPLVMPPSTTLYSIVGFMLLSRRFDMNSPKIIRIGRIVFIAYVILYQLFLLYVRFQARSINDVTPVTLTNPLSKLLAQGEKSSQQNGGGGGDGFSLAKSFLQSTTTTTMTTCNYDLDQCKKLQGSLLTNIFFMWFLHFRMGQVQPLYFQTMQGILNWFYSPLFQVYALGRNLQRPFQQPQQSMDDAIKKQQDRTDQLLKELENDDDDDDEKEEEEEEEDEEDEEEDDDDEEEEDGEDNVEEEEEEDEEGEDGDDEDVEEEDENDNEDSKEEEEENDDTEESSNVEATDEEVEDDTNADGNDADDNDDADNEEAGDDPSNDDEDADAEDNTASDGDEGDTTTAAEEESE